MSPAENYMDKNYPGVIEFFFESALLRRLPTIFLLVVRICKAEHRKSNYQFYTGANSISNRLATIR